MFFKNTMFLVKNMVFSKKNIVFLTKNMVFSKKNIVFLTKNIVFFCTVDRWVASGLHRPWRFFAWWWLKAQGSRLKAQQGSWLKAQGSRLKAPGSRLKAQSSRLKAQGSKLKAQGSRLKALSSKLEAQSSKLKARRPRLARLHFGNGFGWKARLRRLRRHISSASAAHRHGIGTASTTASTSASISTGEHPTSWHHPAGSAKKLGRLGFKRILTADSASSGFHLLTTYCVFLKKTRCFPKNTVFF
jgi:hypothetical protein